MLISSMLFLVLGPVLINAVALVRHQIDFDAAPGQVGSSRPEA